LLAEAPAAPVPTTKPPTNASATADFASVPMKRKFLIREFRMFVMMFPSFRTAPVAPTGDKSEELG
jgi:hypothetical protein